MPQEPQPLHDYTVRISDRARRVRLVVTARDGLVVVVPRRSRGVDPAELVRRHHVWIERALARTAERREHRAGADSAPVPERVELPGIGARWTIVLSPGAGPSVRGTLRGDVLTLSGAVEDRAACLSAIRRAVGRASRERLPLMLGGVEAETGWRARAVAVRRQKTRWGSCTSAGAVSLNESLAFLPARLVRFVLVHELAHTVRMDHSPAFWALVEAHQADWRAARRDLRDAWRHVPPWAEPERRVE